VTSLLGKLVWLFPESVPLEALFTEAVAQPSAAHVTHPYSPRCLEDRRSRKSRSSILHGAGPIGPAVVRVNFDLH
jgi:hypothetical protein